MKKNKLSPAAKCLRLRDQLITHRKRCRKLPNLCPKCSLLRLQEDMANLRNAVKFCEQSRVPREQLFMVIAGMLDGGV